MCKKMTAKQWNYILNMENTNGREYVAKKLGISVSTYARCKAKSSFSETVLLLIDEYLENIRLIDEKFEITLELELIKDLLAKNFEINQKLKKVCVSK